MLIGNNPSIANKKTITYKDNSFMDSSTSMKKLLSQFVKRSLSSEYYNNQSRVRKPRSKARTFINRETNRSPESMTNNGTMIQQEEIKSNGGNHTRSLQEFLLSNSTSFELSLKKNQKSTAKEDLKMKALDSSSSDNMLATRNTHKEYVKKISKDIEYEPENSEQNVIYEIAEKQNDECFMESSCNKNNLIKENNNTSEIELEEKPRLFTHSEDDIVVIERKSTEKYQKKQKESNEICSPSDKQIDILLQSGYNSSLRLKDNYKNLNINEKVSISKDRAVSVVDRKCCLPCKLI